MTRRTLKNGPDLSLEMEYAGLVCGIDEAGRGPLAGPVVAACVHIPVSALSRVFWQDVTDSKKLSAGKRAALFTHIREHTCYGIAEASAEEIDTLNIHHATLLAMKRAHMAMHTNFADVKMAAALVDGKFGPQISCTVQPVVKGDSKSLSIAAASILAKVTRDGIMMRLHSDYPHYGWETNAGYPTQEHIESLVRHGITPHHRRSYGPVRDVLAGTGAQGAG